MDGDGTGGTGLRPVGSSWMRSMAPWTHVRRVRWEGIPTRDSLEEVWLPAGIGIALNGRIASSAAESHSPCMSHDKLSRHFFLYSNHSDLFRNQRSGQTSVILHGLGSLARTGRTTARYCLGRRGNLGPLLCREECLRSGGRSFSG